VIRTTDLGVTDRAIYREALTSAQTLAELARAVGLSPRGVSAALSRLKDAGLVAEISTSPAMFAALPPATAVVAAQAEQAVAQATGLALLSRLSRAFANRPDRPASGDVAEVVLGEQACKHAFDAILVAASGEVRACESSYSLRQGTSVYPAVRDQLDRGVRFRVLYDRGGFEDPIRLADLDQEMSAGEEARIVDIPFKLVLTDEPIGWLALRLPAYGNFARLRIRDPTVLAALGALFESLWEQAMPLPGVPHHPVGGHRNAAAASDATLSWLLAAGASEQAIADFLGCHVRTARRRVREMMARLDAHTAFQAGYQLVRRGHPAVTGTGAPPGMTTGTGRD
jgi:DNA-binding CsgD family transcriptional regulator